MFIYEKKLQYPVKIKNPNPALAKFIISQYGGPDGVEVHKKGLTKRQAFLLCKSLPAHG